jgi:hypothetical protein
MIRSPAAIASSKNSTFARHCSSAGMLFHVLIGMLKALAPSLLANSIKRIATYHDHPSLSSNRLRHSKAKYSSGREPSPVRPCSPSRSLRSRLGRRPSLKSPLIAGVPFAGWG